MTSLERTPPEQDSRVIQLIRNKWLQAGLAGIPFAGGPIQSFLSSVVTEIDKKRWREYWDAVESKLDEMDQKKIDITYFSSEDFILRLRLIHSEVVKGVDETKLRYLRDYLIACAKETAFDKTWKDLFLRYLQEMTGSHILVLHQFYTRQCKLSFKDRFELPQRIADSPISIDDLRDGLRGGDPVLLELLTADLSARGLIGRWTGAPQEPAAWSVTDSGLKLMEFLQR